jgi:hypothetical protein
MRIGRGAAAVAVEDEGIHPVLLLWNCTPSPTTGSRWVRQDRKRPLRDLQRPNGEDAPPAFAPSLSPQKKLLDGQERIARHKLPPRPRRWGDKYF